MAGFGGFSQNRYHPEASPYARVDGAACAALRDCSSTLDPMRPSRPEVVADLIRCMLSLMTDPFRLLGCTSGCQQAPLMLTSPAPKVCMVGAGRLNSRLLVDVAIDRN